MAILGWRGSNATTSKEEHACGNKSVTLRPILGFQLCKESLEVTIVMYAVPACS